MRKLRVIFFSLFLVFGLAASTAPSPKEIFIHQEYYQTLYKDFPVGIAFVDKNGSFLYANNVLCNFLGRTEDELRKLDWREITVRQDIEISEGALAKIISGEDKSFTLFKQYIHKRGDYLWARVTVLGIRNNKNDFEHFVKVVEPLSSSLFLEAEISTKLQMIGETLEEITKKGTPAGLGNFFVENWKTLIPWLIGAILAIGGVLFKIQSGSREIEVLRREIHELTTKNKDE